MSSPKNLINCWDSANTVQTGIKNSIYTDGTMKITNGTNKINLTSVSGYINTIPMKTGDVKINVIDGFIYTNSDIIKISAGILNCTTSISFNEEKFATIDIGVSQLTVSGLTPVGNSIIINSGTFRTINSNNVLDIISLSFTSSMSGNGVISMSGYVDVKGTFNVENALTVTTGKDTQIKNTIKNAGLEIINPIATNIVFNITTSRIAMQDESTISILSGNLYCTSATFSNTDASYNITSGTLIIDPNDTSSIIIYGNKLTVSRGIATVSNGNLHFTELSFYASNLLPSQTISQILSSQQPISTVLTISKSGTSYAVMAGNFLLYDAYNNSITLDINISSSNISFIQTDNDASKIKGKIYILNDKRYSVINIIDGNGTISGQTLTITSMDLWYIAYGVQTIQRINPIGTSDFGTVHYGNTISNITYPLISGTVKIIQTDGNNSVFSVGTIDSTNTSYLNILSINLNTNIATIVGGQIALLGVPEYINTQIGTIINVTSGIAIIDTVAKSLRIISLMFTINTSSNLSLINTNPSYLYIDSIPTSYGFLKVSENQNLSILGQNVTVDQGEITCSNILDISGGNLAVITYGTLYISGSLTLGNILKIATDENTVYISFQYNDSKVYMITNLLSFYGASTSDSNISMAGNINCQGDNNTYGNISIHGGSLNISPDKINTEMILDTNLESYIITNTNLYNSHKAILNITGGSFSTTWGSDVLLETIFTLSNLLVNPNIIFGYSPNVYDINILDGTIECDKFDIMNDGIDTRINVHISGGVLNVLPDSDGNGIFGNTIFTNGGSGHIITKNSVSKFIIDTLDINSQSLKEEIKTFNIVGDIHNPVGQLSVGIDIFGGNTGYSIQLNRNSYIDASPMGRIEIFCTDYHAPFNYYSAISTRNLSNSGNTPNVGDTVSLIQGTMYTHFPTIGYDDGTYGFINIIGGTAVVVNSQTNVDSSTYQILKITSVKFTAQMNPSVTIINNPSYQKQPIYPYMYSENGAFKSWKNFSYSLDLDNDNIIGNNLVDITEILATASSGTINTTTDIINVIGNINGNSSNNSSLILNNIVLGNSIYTGQIVSGEFGITSNTVIDNVISLTSGNCTVGVNTFSVSENSVIVSGNCTSNGNCQVSAINDIIYGNCTIVSNISGNTVTANAVCTMSGNVVLNGWIGNLSGNCTVSGNCNLGGSGYIIRNNNGNIIDGYNYNISNGNIELVSGFCTVTGNCIVNGDNDTTSNCTVTGNCIVTGTVTNGNCLATGICTLIGNTSVVYGNCTVIGNCTVTGNSGYINGNTTVTGNCTNLSGNCVVFGNDSDNLHGNVSVVGNCSVGTEEYPTYLMGNCTVSGNLTSLTGSCDISGTAGIGTFGNLNEQILTFEDLKLKGYTGVDGGMTLNNDNSVIRAISQRGGNIDLTSNKLNKSVIVSIRNENLSSGDIVVTIDNDPTYINIQPNTSSVFMQTTNLRFIKIY